MIAGCLLNPPPPPPGRWAGLYPFSLSIIAELPPPFPFSPSLSANSVSYNSVVIPYWYVYESNANLYEYVY